MIFAMDLRKRVKYKCHPPRPTSCLQHTSSMALLPIIFFLCHCLISCYLLWGHFHYLTLSIFPSTSSTIPQADGGQATRLLPPQLSQTKTTAKCTFTPSSTLDTMPGPTYSQHALTLPSYPRGSHLITSDITSQLSAPLKGVKVGLLHLFLQHTSCAMSLNENYDSDVRKDMTDSLDKIVVEDKAGKGIYRHDAEGSDDMPVCGDFPPPFFLMRLRRSRHTSNPRSSEQVSRSPSRTASWHWGHGKGYGSWSSEMENIGGRC